MRRGQGNPFIGLDQILLHARPVGVTGPKSVFSGRDPMPRCLLVPFDRFNWVGRHPLPVLAEAGQVELCQRMACLGSLAKPGGSLSAVLPHSVTGVADHPKTK